MKPLPSLKAAAYLAAGIIIARWIPMPIVYLFALVSILALFAILLSNHSFGDYLLIPAITIAGMLLYQTSQPRYDYSPTRVEITGSVLQPPIYREGISSFPLKAEHITADDFSFETGRKVWVKVPINAFKINSGDKLTINGILKPCRERRNPGDFNLKAWRERNGYLGQLTTIGIPEKLESRQSIPMQIRNYIGGKTDRFGGDNSALYKALLIGIRRDLDREFTGNLKATGLSHLIALSGLHVGFLAGLIFGIASLLRLRLPVRYLTAILVIVLFLMIVPARGSTLRAAIMLTVFLSGPVLRRWSPPLNSLGFAALIILFLRPGELFDAGFQLSFAAVGGILLLTPTINDITQPMKDSSSTSLLLTRRYVIHPLLISLAASLMVLPLTSYHFGMMAVGAPVFNLFAIPFLGLIYAGSWFMILIGAVWAGGAEFFVTGLEILVMLWKYIIGAFASISPVIYHRLNPLHIGVLLSIITWVATSRRKLLVRVVLATAIITATFNVSEIIPDRRNFQAWFLDVGHGDAALWVFPDNRVAVIDGGPLRSTTVGDNPVYNVLKYLNCDNVDLLVVSHPEADHIGGLIGIVEELPIKLAITGTGRSETETFHHLINSLHSRDYQLVNIVAGATIGGLPEGYHLEALGPPARSQDWSANDASLVLRLTVPLKDSKSISLLTAGDAEGRAEAAILQFCDPTADLLKVSHHGSPTSTSLPFIEAVHPDVAVISKGSWNELSRFQSDEEVATRIESVGCTVYKTDEEGTLIFEPANIDGESQWSIVDWRNPSFKKWLFGWI